MAWEWGAWVQGDGSGGRIRTSDLWVMSPTSCRCSTPRRRPTPRPTRSQTAPRGARGGLASPGGAPRSTLRRCGGSRPGSGWDRVGPPRSRPRTPRDAPRLLGGHAHAHSVMATMHPRFAERQRWDGRPPRPDAPPAWERDVTLLVATLGHEHGSAPVGCPPSTCRLATTSSRWGLSPSRDGGTRLGVGFPLRCFQRFAHPDMATRHCALPHNRHTSGPSGPVLSY